MVVILAGTWGQLIDDGRHRNWGTLRYPALTIDDHHRIEILGTSQDVTPYRRMMKISSLSETGNNFF